VKSRLASASVLVAAAAIAAAPAWADDARLDPARNEVSVFGGISILDARTSQQATVTWPTIPGLPGLPGWPGAPTGDVQVRTETSLGNSALVGFRYAFYLRKQLALEADVAVAPGQDLHSRVDLCGSSSCYGRSDDERAGTGQAFDAAMDALFGGSTGSHARGGMDGMHGGEGHYDGGYGFGGHSVTAWHYGAGLTYDILGNDVRPFVAVGAGGVSYDGTPGAKTDFTLRFGAGLKAYFGRLGARVDAVDYLVFDNFLTGRNEHDVHLTGGAFVRF
jgi:hypothetical protein